MDGTVRAIRYRSTMVFSASAEITWLGQTPVKLNLDLLRYEVRALPEYVATVKC